MLVSHDRGLLGGVCDEFVRVRAGRIEPYDGDLADYARWLGQGEDAATNAPSSIGGDTATDTVPLTAADRREQRRLDAERRNRLTPLRAEMRRIEEDLERCNTERSAMEAQLADPALYAASTGAARGLPLRHSQLSAQIEALEERWLAIGAELEAATAAP